jgi:hypothetical protein
VSTLFAVGQDMYTPAEDSQPCTYAVAPPRTITAPLDSPPVPVYLSL